MKLYSGTSFAAQTLPLTGVRAAKVSRQLLLCGLVCIATNAFADDKEDIAKLKSECTKLSRPADDSGYDELIDKMLKRNSISQDYTPFSNDAELVTLLQTLKKPENLDFAQDTVERDFGYFSDMFSIGKNVDETYLNNSYRCHFVEAYVDVGSKANKELKSYFQWLLNRTTEHVNLLAAEKADREDYAKGVRDEEEAYKKRLLTPKGNAATVGGFKITANSCVARGKVGTLNPFLEPKAWNGSKFLIVDASFKNVSTSSKYMFPGSVAVSKNGKVYKFDKFEMVNESGFGSDAEPLNPLITYRTKLIFRIPADLTGEIVWHPDERTDDVTVSCGSI
ncbi:DUF4352 domain-containing protein [Pseudomonas sp. MWU13-2100]|uniref:DUF4352 domain-containing protein n=1 Tax=Pseudomonas sp. MWU13-2100 TaxID=2935075 RepID=UPI00200DA7F8|nr:DUF4352 domain-containing protein [Pseudomonas sp. MWU13-2100]